LDVLLNLTCLGQGNKQHSVAGATAAGASSSSQLFSPEREGRIGNKEILWPVMVITAIDGDACIDAQEVPRRIRRKAYKLFEGDRIRNRRKEQYGESSDKQRKTKAPRASLPPL